MARKKFEEGFKENAIQYCKTHSDKTIKACAADLGIGYSTLRRWIAQSEEQEQAAVIEAVFGKEVAEDAEVAEDVVSEESPVAETVETPIESPAIEEPQVVEEAPVVEIGVDVVVSEQEDDVEEAQEISDSVNKLEGVKAQFEGFIETAGSGVSDAVQLFGLYKKRHELKKVQKKLQKEKERRLKK